MMNRVLAVACVGLAVVAAANAHGQHRSSLYPDPGYVAGAGSAADDSTRSEPPSTPMFTFGDLNVDVWAPVGPHYNGDANRDPAGESFWNAG
jgi:hypothetical protein